MWGGFLLFVLVVAAILYFSLSQHRGQRPKAVLLSSLAGRWNGRVRKGGFLNGDRLDIQVDEVAGEITFGEDLKNEFVPAGWTRVRFDWRSDRRMRVAPEGFETRIRRLLGGADIEFDDPAFDDRFWVESSHPGWARGLLPPATRQALVRLQWAPRGDYSDVLTLDVGASGVSLRISRILIDNPDALGTFVELCISILRKARGFAEVEGVVLEAAVVQAGSACPVCGQEVAREVLPCPACRTPHHRDCWRYFGGCAIFGCQTRMRKP